MGRYIAQRAASLLPILFGISLLVFAIFQLVPGDPAMIILGTDATPDALRAMRKSMGLDQPLIMQYLHWMWGIVHGDFGVSFRSGVPVFPLLLKGFIVTLQLTLFAALFGWLIAVPLGILSSVRAHTPLDVIFRTGAILGVSIPNFAVGTLLLLILSLYFGWFPPLDVVNFWDRPLEAFQVFILPAISLGIILAAGILRMTRAAFLETLNMDFMRTARAKGNNEWTVVVGHGLRNSALPIITLAGMQFGHLLGGAVVIEQLFSIPGLGLLILEGIYQRDYPVVQGGVLFIATTYVLVNLLVDIIYTWVDPRIKY